jgi:hypothetical protein
MAVFAGKRRNGPPYRRILSANAAKAGDHYGQQRRVTRRPQRPGVGRAAHHRGRRRAAGRSPRDLGNPNIDRIARVELYAKDSRVAILRDGKKLPVSRAGYARLAKLL